MWQDEIPEHFKIGRLATPFSDNESIANIPIYPMPQPFGLEVLMPLYAFESGCFAGLPEACLGFILILNIPFIPFAFLPIDAI